MTTDHFEFTFFADSTALGKILIEADDIGHAYRLACASQQAQHATSIGHGRGRYSLFRVGLGRITPARR